MNPEVQPLAASGKDCPADDVTLYGLLIEAFTKVSGLVQHDLGMPSAWFEVLLRLSRTPGEKLRITDVANAVSFTSGGFTRLADRIEEAGLVGRVRDVTDRRASYLVLTEKGRTELDAALAIHVAHLTQHFAPHMNGAERRTLERILRRMRDAG